MKKQINPTIKAYLIRSALYFLLLLTVCAIPFALAQRNAARRNAAKPTLAQQNARAHAPADARSYSALFPANARNVSAQPRSKLSVKRPTGTSIPLWYNGDFNQLNGLANGDNWDGSGGYARVYDDFFVNDPNGWDVTGVFSDNLSTTNITGAYWEIRQGISAGNGGTLIASGMTMTPIVTLSVRNQPLALNAGRSVRPP